MYFKIITLLTLFLFNRCIQSDRLIGTYIITRHGERSPSYGYGKYPDKSAFWRNGLGQLTIRGQWQHVLLGQYLRQRYSNLVNSTYVASEIYVRSSDYDRTLMSAYSNLVGLYPFSQYSSMKYNQFDSNTWPDSVPWQPIPVHTVPKSQDHLMAVSSCDRYEVLVEEMRKSPRITELNAQYIELFHYLEKHTNQSIQDIFIAWDIADTALIEELYNVTPIWITPSILKQLRQLEDLCFFHLYYSSEINRLRGGPIISDLLQNGMNLILNNGKGKKMKILIGHDITISAVLAFLGVNYIHQPGFASALFFDLYQKDDNTYSIQIEYMSTTDDRRVRTIAIPGCSNHRCPWNEFIDLYTSKLPDDLDNECRLIKKKNSLPPIVYTYF